MSVKPVAWTPGPWSVIEPHHIIVDAKGEGIASGCWGRDDGIDEANARLIASAPELAEALQALLDASDCPQYNAAKDAAISLLARITPK